MTEPGTSMSMAVAATSPVGRGPINRKRGRKPAQFWVSFTTLEEPYKSRTATCRHCAATVNYHKKWEQAKSHLLKCEPFLKLMQETDPHARPEWFVVEVDKRRRSAARTLPIDLVARSDDPSYEPGLTETAATKASTAVNKPMGRAKKRDSLGGVDGVASSELLLLQAMRKGSAVDTEFLGHVLAREQDGAGSLQSVVDKVYKRVKRSIDVLLRASSGGLPVLVVQWSETSKTVEYRVAKDDKSFFVEQITIPTAASESDDATAAWLVEDVRRAAQDLGVREHPCILQAPMEFVDKVSALSDSESNVLCTTQIRHSPLRSFFELVNDVLVSSISSEEDRNPLGGLLEVAVKCYDVLSLLGVSTCRSPPLSRYLDTTRRMVGELRSLSLAEAFWAIVNADKLLDAHAVRSIMETLQIDSAARESVCLLVETVEFSSRLRRYYNVLQPLNAALALSEKTVVHASDVIVAFASIERSYRDSPYLTDAQKRFLAVKIARYQGVIAQEGFAVVHLLDPAYLGELLDDAAKAKAELELIAMVEGDDHSEKQALYVEYTQFQVAAVQQHATGDGFVLRMLKERKKTMLQYWLTDGRKWPRLQAIVLRLEQTPVDAGLDEGLERDCLPAAGSQVSNDKEMFLQKNIRLLALSDLLNIKPIASSTSARNSEIPSIENEVLI